LAILSPYYVTVFPVPTLCLSGKFCSRKYYK
jgi:hypothetical protein